MLGLCAQIDLESAIEKARKTSRWQELKDQQEPEETSQSGMKYGLIKKEDYEKEMAESVEIQETADLLKGIIDTEND